MRDSLTLFSFSVGNATDMGGVTPYTCSALIVTGSTSH
jgi:hypothetical protein